MRAGWKMTTSSSECRALPSSRAVNIVFLLALCVATTAIVLNGTTARGLVISLVGLVFLAYKDRPSRTVLTRLKRRAAADWRARSQYEAAIDGVIVVVGTAAIFGIGPA